MPNGDGKRLIIVGAGLAGALMACYLAKLGYTVHVFERRPDPRKPDAAPAGSGGGRSINLALSARGIKGLAGVGLAEPVLADAIPMRGRMIHTPTGHTAFQPYSKNRSDAINSVSRAGLNLTLINAAAAAPGVRLYFDASCLDVDLDAPAATFEHTSTGVRSTVKADLVIGADGAYSAVRDRLQHRERFDYSQAYLEHGYKELTIPPASDGDFALEPNALHIWPRGGAMMIALPNTDRSFTCTLFWPFDGRGGLYSLKAPDQIARHFADQYPDAVPLMPTLADDYLKNPIGTLVTVRCRPWHHDGKVCLIGDAAHAIVPFFGQGMNAAFEDCTALFESIQAHAGDLPRALEHYESLRKENADAIADMALDNFVEMRDKVGSAAFRRKKKLEQTLHTWFPNAFMPQYNMVSFSTIPYAEARQRAERQARVIRLAAIWAGVLLLGLALGLVIGLMRLGR